MSTSKKAIAEAVGTFWLVLGGCGAAVLSGGGIGLVGISLAFGLTVLTMAYAIGPISGCHLNPAVTLGLVAGGRFPKQDVVPYIVAQLIGATLGAAVVLLLAKGAPGGYDPTTGGLAANGYGEHSPGRYAMTAALVSECVLTFVFLVVILGSTSARAAPGFAGLSIGLCLTLIHLVGIPITNLSVNPARSTGPALFVGGWALEQLWLFWLAPIVGAVAAGVFFRTLSPEPTAQG